MLLAGPARVRERGARPSAGAPRRRHPGLPPPPPWPGCASAAAGWSGAAGCARAAVPPSGPPTHGRRPAPPRRDRPRAPAPARAARKDRPRPPALRPSEGGPAPRTRREGHRRPRAGGALPGEPSSATSVRVVPPLSKTRRTCLGPVQRRVDSRRPVSSFRTRSNHGPGPVSDRESVRASMTESLPSPDSTLRSRRTVRPGWRRSSSSRPGHGTRTFCTTAPASSGSSARATSRSSLGLSDTWEPPQSETARRVAEPSVSPGGE